MTVHDTLFLFFATGPMVASVSAGWKAIPRANTRSARTIPVPNTGKFGFSHVFIMIKYLFFQWNNDVLYFQLIQDEIKALVQLQNRQSSIQPHTDFSPTLVTKTTRNTKDFIFPLISTDCTVPKHVASDNDSLAAPALTPFSSPSPPLQRSGEEQATTVLSSGYGTLSTWETGLEPAGSPGEDEDGTQGREKHHWSPNFQEDTDTTVIGCQQNLSHEKTLAVNEPNPSVYQQRTSG